MSSNPTIRRIRKYVSYTRTNFRSGSMYLYIPPHYPTTPNEKLIPALPKDVQVRRKPLRFNMRMTKGPEARLLFLAGRVTKLFKYERVELTYHQAVEVRGYAERLISTAIRYGDCHRPTMELATFWLQERQLIHKLFKVLVPRYAEYTGSFTHLWRHSPYYELSAAGEFCKSADGKFMTNRQKRTPETFFITREVGILELKGNPFPPIKPPPPNNRLILTNVLLAAARNDWFKNGKSKGDDHPSEP